MQPPLAPSVLRLKVEGAYAVLSRAGELEKDGKDIIHLEIGQPDFPTPANIVEAGISALKEGKTKYNPPLGIPELREELASFLTHSRGVAVEKNNIAVTPSGKMAIFAAMSAVLEPGDEVIYPDPGFPTYHILVDYLGCVKKPVPLREKTGFSFDMDIFASSLSYKTKLIILNSPSNPTGGIIPARDLQIIADLVSKTGTWVMTDEMYARLIFEPSYPSYYGLPGVQDRTILVDGFSKTYSMTGWRIGYLAAPTALIKQIDYLLTHTVGCTATFTQHAALEALRGPQAHVSRMVQEFAKRRNYIVKALNDIKGVTCATPAGAFYVFPNVTSFSKSSAEIADHLLEKGGVALLPGTSFGEYGEGYLRISYAAGMKKLEEGVRRIKTSLASL